LLEAEAGSELIAKRTRYTGSGVFTENGGGFVFLVCGEKIGYAAGAGGNREELST